MNRRPRNDRRRRDRFTPIFEGLEAREVLSVSLPSTGIDATGPPPAVMATAKTQAAPIPTPHELARQQFVARFRGKYVTGPGRFTDQASQTYLFGSGTSSAFLHGDFQMAFYTPTDSSQPINGQAVMMVKNITSTGSELIVDLQADPTSLDRRGRPTRFDWTVNGGSAGTFGNATGQGTLELQYRPGGKSGRHGFGAGSIGAVFRGSVDTTGLNDITRNV